MRRGTRPNGHAPAAGDAVMQVRRQGRAIELFQLAFCQVASAQLPLADFALKGGGNLRFFLRSRRRSADLDLDHLGRDFDRFARRVDEALASRALSELLRMREIRLLFERRRAKDTETVKRWKFKLARPGMEDASSKIEFSNRGSSAQPVFEQMDAELARSLGGVAVRINHYPPVAAIEQKVGALAGRRATEPRDVFDLDHLFRQYPDTLPQAELEPGTTRDSIDRALQIPYADYQTLVVEYLEEGFVDLYGTEQAWTDMVLRVVQHLEEKLGNGR